MSDLISRDAAIEAVVGWETVPTDEELEIALMNVSAIDAIPVEWLRRWRDVTDIPLLAMNIDSILKVWEESNKYWGEANKEQEAQDDGN